MLQKEYILLRWYNIWFHFLFSSFNAMHNAHFCLQYHKYICMKFMKRHASHLFYHSNRITCIKTTENYQLSDTVNKQLCAYKSHYNILVCRVFKLEWKLYFTLDALYLCDYLSENFMSRHNWGTVSHVYLLLFAKKKKMFMKLWYTVFVHRFGQLKTI